MAGAGKGVVTAAPAVDAAPVDPQVQAEAQEAVDTADKPKPGWVRHLQSDTLHEVEDVRVVHAAYPGQYESAEKPGNNSKKIGWPEAQEATAAE